MPRRPLKRARKPVSNSQEEEDMLAEYDATLLETLNDAKARKASGAGPNARFVAARRIRATHSLKAQPPPGRPRKFTEQVLERALEVLDEQPRKAYTRRTLLAALISEGLLDAGADVDTFGKRLREYVHSKGGHIDMTSTSTIFLIRTADHEQRVQQSEEALTLLQQQPLESIVFIDETAYEEAPHPKGTPTGAAHSHATAPA
jgi:hypothetical protein